MYEFFGDSAQESKWAGGCGSSWTFVRSAGSYIKGTNGKSNGIVPFLKTYESTAKSVNQGGKREGSFAPYLEPWHADYPSFIELKRNTGEESLRTHKLYPAAFINDLLMRRKEKGEMWSFFSPLTCPELVTTYGKEWEEHYLRYEAEGKYVSQLPADVVWKRTLTSLYETGAPWITFKD
jgi:ribonucleoside-diphosphate reductase alpha chain